ncbi:MAG TPA: hypothetical protein VLL08_00555 [Kineosporiaceae bacterium]|nr:hypothetical protein [Kineosporiaceae bacterium]
MASEPIRTADQVRTALHEAAAAYQPDRATILARVRAGQAGSEASLGHRPRHHRRSAGVAGIAGIAASVAAVFGVGVAVNWAAVRSNTPLAPATMPSTVASPYPTATHAVPRATPSHRPKSRPAPTARPSQSPTASPAKVLSRRGFLWSTGTVDKHSIDNWSQSNVTLRTQALLTALQVRVRIARTPDLRDTGAWCTLLPGDFTTTVDQQSDAMVYTFVLKPGATMRPGEYTFAVQYNHAVGGRDARLDTYQATASGGTSVEVRGGF